MRRKSRVNVFLLSLSLFLLIPLHVAAFERILPQDRAINAAQAMDGLMWDMIVSGQKLENRLMDVTALVVGLRVESSAGEMITVYVEIDRDHQYFDEWVETVKTSFNGSFLVIFSPNKLQGRRTIGAYLYPSPVIRYNNDQKVHDTIGELLTDLDLSIGVRTQLENKKMYHGATAYNYFDVDKHLPKPHGVSYEFVTVDFWVPNGPG